MEYLISCLLVLMLCIFLLCSGCGKASGKGNATPATPQQSQVLARETLTTKSLTRAEIAQKLEKLKKSSPPTTLVPGAMCYKVASPPDRADYICPACGERTLYVVNAKEGPGAWSAVFNDIPGCRQHVKEIRGISATLDESEFCRKCRPGSAEPHLWLIVRYPGEKDAHRVKGVTEEDLQLISEFLSGSKVHHGERDTQTPLRDYATRLSELLGIGESH